MTRSTTKAPTYADLPLAKSHAARGGPELCEIGVRLEVVTPILGGSYRTRIFDDVDIIRAATVRGHLRFWWRALYAERYASAEELYQRESTLWGRAATGDGGRSAVEIRIFVERDGEIDDDDIRPYPSKGQPQTPGAYALWTARAETKTNMCTAPRRQPGTQFQVTLRVAATSEADLREVKNSLRAWILFGGYGGRTRRGLGSLKVIADASDWLPSAATRDALSAVFGMDVFAAPTRAVGDVPWLGGAAIHVGKTGRDASKAWITALDWLRVFRQGEKGQPGSRAREPGPNGNNQRPSISNWPEGDKVRQLSRPRKGLPWAHTPRHNETAAWPRAGFGLPIVGQFQSKSREKHPTRKKNGKPDEKYWNELPPNHPNYGTEPDGFELRWRAGTERDRLASPLIVKALPLADGDFAPCALWLNRAYPSGGEVILRNTNNSQAPFDRLVAHGDTPHFSALANKQSLRQAFLDWLQVTFKTTVVAP